MRTKSLGKWKTRLDRLAPNPIETPKDEMGLHAVVLLAAKMKSGKTVFASSRLRDLQESNLCHRCFVISPTAKSVQNRKLFEGLCDPDDLYEDPNYASILDIKDKLIAMLQDWEEYKAKVDTWKTLQKRMQEADFDLSAIAPDAMMVLYEQGLLDPTPPEWPYKDNRGQPRMPICHMFVDDAQGSELFRCSTKNPFLEFVPRHRHIGVGCSVWIAVQNFGGYGTLPKQIRSVCTHCAIWRPADVDKRHQIAKELSAEVDQQTLLEAMDYACHDHPNHFLWVDLAPKSKEYQFRKNFSDLILID